MFAKHGFDLPAGFCGEVEWGPVDHCGVRTHCGSDIVAAPMSKLLTLACTLMLAGCTATSGVSEEKPGARRPTSKEAIDCSIPGSPLVISTDFIPGSASNAVDVLQVTFRRSQPKSGDVEAGLRECTDIVVRRVRVDYPMLITGWFNDDGPLHLPDGSDSMTYDPKSGLVQTWNQSHGR